MAIPQIDVDFNSPDIIADPYPLFADLRNLGPLLKHVDGNYVVTSYAAAREVLLRAEDFSSANANQRMWFGAEYAEAQEVLSHACPVVPALLTTDPPVHTRHRGIVRQAFGVRRVAQLENFMQQVAHELAGTLARSDSTELYGDFASVLPLRLITDAVGAGQDDLGRIKEWSDALVAHIGRAVTPQQAVELAHKRVELHTYLLARIADAGRQPTDDILGDLVRAERADPADLSLPEMVGILEQLLTAGNETSARLITFVIQKLAVDPELDRRVRHNRELVGPLAEEMLRLETPVQMKYRKATRVSTLAGYEIPEGSTVMVLFGSANRDESEFPQADKLRLDRPNLRAHLAFGFGPHLCLGAQLARAEARIAINALLDVVDEFRLSTRHPAPEIGPSFVHRGLSALNLELAHTVMR